MNLNDFGKFLEKKRRKAGVSSADTAIALETSASYYSKLENGKQKPSKSIVDRICSLYSLPQEDIILVEQLSGHRPNENTSSINSESINTEDAVNKPGQMQVKIDPEKHKILFSDGMYVSISQNGVVFDFGQKIGPVNEQVIVARIGVSYAHAKRIYELLGKQLEKSEELGIEN